MFGFFNRGHGLFLENHASRTTSVGEIVRGVSSAIPESEPVRTALKLCLDGMSNIAVTDKKGECVRGRINSRMLLNYLGGGSLHQLYVTRKDALKLPVSRIMEPVVTRLDRKRNLHKTLAIFRGTGCEAIPLTNKGRIDGMVTEGDMVSMISRPTGVKVWEVMTRKPVVAKTSNPVSEVAGMIVRGGYKRLPVLRDSFITGVVGSSDILKYLNTNRNLSGLRKDRNSIEKAMNKFVSTVDPNADVHEAVGIMGEKVISMLPVVRDYQTVGILTHRDILEAM
ncbi:MAG: CBS domain-containing protein [Candidatus Aenigmarchaeota archaeon]|nr:CBS domain-containing protein [Candidatus Aenigmarchaeota archaeon]